MVVTTRVLIQVGMGCLMVNLEDNLEDSIGDGWRVTEEMSDHSRTTVLIETAPTTVDTSKDTTTTVARLWAFTIKREILVGTNEAIWKHFP